MTNKLNPATTNYSNNQNLSSKYLKSQADNFLNTNFKAKNGRPAKLSFTELLFCLELKREYTCETWLGLYRYILDKRKNSEIDLVLPTYANFLKPMKKLVFYLYWLIHYQTQINRQIFFKKELRIVFVDSASIPVCKLIRSSRHKTMKEFANYSKSTTGWYYGFRLHLTIDFKTKEVLHFRFLNSNLDDRKYLAK